MFLAITGCSSTKIVVPNLNSEPNRIEKTQRVIAIDGKKLAGLEVTARPGAVQLTVVYGDALLASIKHKIENSHKSTFIIHERLDGQDYDYVISISNQITSLCGGTSCALTSKTTVDLNDNKGNVVFKNNSFDDSFVWNQPGSAIAIGIIGGLTVIGMPIAIPIGVDIENEELKTQVTASNERVSAKIAESILEVTRTEGLKQQLQSTPSARLKAVKEMFDNGQISAEDYEVKRKEILSEI